MKRINYIAFPTISRGEIKASIEIGILKSEKEIIDYKYRKTLEAIKSTKGYKGVKYVHPIEDYDESILEENSIEDYMKHYPIKFDSEKGIYTN